MYSPLQSSLYFLVITLNFQNGNCSMIEEYKLFVLKEKTIYHHLNMLKEQGTIFMGRCWCPRYLEEGMFKALSDLSRLKPHVAGGSLTEIPKDEGV